MRKLVDKKMKKVLALFLTVVFALCIFSGCGEGKKKIDDNDAVQALVCEYVDLLFDGCEGALDYVMQDAAPYLETQYAIEMIASLSTISEKGDIPEKDAERFNELAQEFYKEFVKDVNCNVTDADIEDDAATVTANVTVPPYDALEDAVKTIREEGRIEALLTEEEMAELKKNGFSIRCTELTMEEVLKEVDGKSVIKEIVFEMEKFNGDWKIVYIEGDLF